MSDYNGPSDGGWSPDQPGSPPGSFPQHGGYPPQPQQPHQYPQPGAGGYPQTQPMPQQYPQQGYMGAPNQPGHPQQQGPMYHHDTGGSKTPLFAALGVAGVALVGALTWFLWPDGEDDTEAATGSSTTLDTADTATTATTATVATTEATTATSVETETSVGEATEDVFDLQIGDCLASFDALSESATEVKTVETVDCSEPHAYEVYHDVEPWGIEESFPGQDVVEQVTVDECLGAFEVFVGLDYQSSVLDISVLYPTSSSWTLGLDRKITCLVYRIDETLVSGTLQGSGL